METTMRWRWAWLLIVVLAGGCRTDSRASRPFVGITHIERAETQPRPVRMHIVLVDLDAPGVRFLVTPPNGDAARETTRQTTLEFLVEHHAQVAINGHFFTPWPTWDAEVDLKGPAASCGQVYSDFEEGLGYPFADNLPAINIGADNTASIFWRGPSADSRAADAAMPRLYNVLSGNEQIVAGGVNTAGTGKWDNTLNPRTAIGIAPPRRLVLLVVDGRQAGVSEGMTTSEAAGVLLRYGVTDAINLDGGGSTTLAMADPAPRVVNVPVGIDNKPGTLRLVGSNLGVFAVRR